MATNTLFKGIAFVAYAGPERLREFGDHARRHISPWARRSKISLIDESGRTSISAFDLALGGEREALHRVLTSADERAANGDAITACLLLERR
jgi:hypothetical protein